jgi:hypothetical protein
MLTRANTSSAIALPIEATAIRLNPTARTAAVAAVLSSRPAPDRPTDGHLRVRRMGTVSLITE